MRKYLPRFAPATWIALTALFVALLAPPAAFALGKHSVGTVHLKKGAVTAKKISRGAVKPGKIRKGAVKTGKIRDGAVTTRKIGPRAVGGSQIKPRTPGVILAGVNVDNFGDVENGFNRLGGQPTADVNTTTLRYRVTIPGANMSDSSIVHVSPRIKTVKCAPNKLAGPAEEIHVECVVPSGDPSLSPFSLTLIKE